MSTTKTPENKEPGPLLGLGSSGGLGPTPPDDEHPYTYASTQATNCAGCGEYKHTPLRIDAMGGYVCLTCIDRKLGALLGEFGYAAPQQPLTDEQHMGLFVELNAPRVQADGPSAMFAIIVRAVEQAHGIGA